VLTPADMERFRARLEEQRTAIQQQIAELQRSVAAPDESEDAENDDGEMGNLFLAREGALDQMERARTQMAEVERALERITEGSYGLSEVSGNPIPIERLEVHPAATTLVDE